jgi:hypothetical protein
MTEAVEIDFTVSNNETWDQSFVWTDGGHPVDLTGMSLKIQLRDPANLSNVIIEISTANSLILVGAPTSGQWQLSVPASKTKDVPAGSYSYDVLNYLANDPRVWRRQKGTITVEQGVTTL